MKSLYQEIQEAFRRWERNQKVIVKVDCTNHTLTQANGKVVKVPDSQMYECGTTIEERDDTLEAFEKGLPVHFNIQVSGEYVKGDNLVDQSEMLLNRFAREADFVLSDIRHVLRGV